MDKKKRVTSRSQNKPKPKVKKREAREVYEVQFRLRFERGRIRLFIDEIIA